MHVVDRLEGSGGEKEWKEDLCHERTYLFVIIDLLFWTVLYCGGCPARYRMFSIILVSTYWMPAAPTSPCLSQSEVSPDCLCVLGGGGGSGGALRTIALTKTRLTEEDSFFSTLEGRKDWGLYNNAVSCCGCRGLAEGEWVPALIRSQN